MYKVIAPFSDRCDDFHVYEVGDVYPRKGHRPPKGRISELTSKENALGQPLIVKED